LSIKIISSKIAAGLGHYRQLIYGDWFSVLNLIPDASLRFHHVTTALARTTKSAGAPFALFMFALFAVSFAYGFAANHFKIFPYGVIRDAVSAWNAIGRIEPSRFPPGFLKGVPPKAMPASNITFRSGAGDEMIFMNGGFFQFTEQCPNFGCLAWIMDRDGKVYHTWEADPAILPDPVIQHVLHARGSQEILLTQT